MNNKTGKGLAKYALLQLGKPYWWGTFGQTASASLYEAKKKQYPAYYTASDFPSQYGKRVHDCVGLIKGYLWSETPASPPVYDGSQDVAVGGLYGVCAEKGDIASMPDELGVCVFMADMSHVGVYVGNGHVVEAMGHAYGVVQTDLRSRGWAFWGKPRWISYETQPEPTPDPQPEPTLDDLPVVRYGERSESVKAMQDLLILRGKDCGWYGADGDFGPKTLGALRAFKKEKGLSANDVCDLATWIKLITNK